MGFSNHVAAAILNCYVVTKIVPGGGASSHCAPRPTPGEPLPVLTPFMDWLCLPLHAAASDAEAAVQEGGGEEQRRWFCRIQSSRGAGS